MTDWVLSGALVVLIVLMLVVLKIRDRGGQ
jgi:hypothetical protein